MATKRANVTVSDLDMSSLVSISANNLSLSRDDLKTCLEVLSSKRNCTRESSIFIPTATGLYQLATERQSVAICLFIYLFSMKFVQQYTVKYNKKENMLEIRR